MRLLPLERIHKLKLFHFRLRSFSFRTKKEDGQTMARLFLPVLLAPVFAWASASSLLSAPSSSSSSLPATRFEGFRDVRSMEGSVTFFISRRPVAASGGGGGSGALRFARAATAAAAATDSSAPSNGLQGQVVPRGNPLSDRGYTRLVPLATGFRFANPKTKEAVLCAKANEATDAKHHDHHHRADDVVQVRLQCRKQDHRDPLDMAGAARFARAKAKAGEKPFYIMPLSPTFWAPASGSYLASTGWFQYPHWAYNSAGYWGCSMLHAPTGQCSNPHGPYASSLGGHGW